MIIHKIEDIKQNISIKIYMDISTWKYMSPADKCAVRDRLGKYISKYRF